MMIDLVVPEVGESIHEVQVLHWKKQEGDWVAKDEEIVEIETEKATVPVPAPVAGRLHEILKRDSEFAEVGDTLARLDAGDEPTAAAATSEKAAAAAQQEGHVPTPAEPPATSATSQPTVAQPAPADAPAKTAVPEPSAPPAKAKPADKDGRQLLRRPAPIQQATVPSAVAQKAPLERAPANEPPAAAERAEPQPPVAAGANERQQHRVPMTILRRTIARRLVDAQQNAALVTTFNEIDMQAVIDLRRQYGPEFQEEFGIKLGFMSFFVKAAVAGLQRCPEINAQIEGNDIVYHHYYDIGVAIGSGKGLVVPVLRNAERLSFAEIERQIADLAARAQSNRLSPDELEGGTFTISNGGIYGSLLSTPIVNPPQSGVLGMHAIQERPVAVSGQVVIRPMMYVALTYDHRLVDGREAVKFLKRLKDVIETPSRLFLEV